MKLPSIIKNIYNNLIDKDIVTIDEIKKILGDDDYKEFKIFIKIFTLTVFKVYYDELSKDKIRQIMILRREIYIDEPTDENEFNELINYFENEEDYESCQKIKNKKYEYNKTR